MLNQTAIYAIRAMGFLAEQKEGLPVLSSTIAEEMEIPKNFLSKILNRLVQAGIIRSIRGRSGGFVLDVDPSEVRVRDVADLFMKLNDFKQCFLGLSRCNGSCGLHIRWKIIVEQFEKLLDETTVDRVF
jgi:Rrf2 family protein